MKYYFTLFFVLASTNTFSNECSSFLQEKCGKKLEEKCLLKHEKEIDKKCKSKKIEFKDSKGNKIDCEADIQKICPNQLMSGEGEKCLNKNKAKFSDGFRNKCFDFMIKSSKEVALYNKCIPKIDKKCGKLEGKKGLYKSCQHDLKATLEKECHKYLN